MLAFDMHFAYLPMLVQLMQWMSVTFQDVVHMPILFTIILHYIMAQSIFMAAGTKATS